VFEQRLHKKIVNQQCRARLTRFVGDLVGWRVVAKIGSTAGVKCIVEQIRSTTVVRHFRVQG
jgi:hypothetical protein